ncbi:MAG: Mov34/MPN/PAD-1 family protein [Rubrobacter sp.]
MNGLMGVRKIRVPRKLALEAHLHLRQAGEHDMEGFALWAGVHRDEEFLVTQTAIPAQEGLVLEDGVCVAVGGEELHRINVWLFEEELALIAQLHSHPTEAYHSVTDDAFPIATTVGALSLVVPFFAREEFSLADCAVYRLDASGRWTGLSVPEVQELIAIED